MKKMIAALVLLGASGSAFSAQMECYVDTAAYDEWSVGYCMSMEFTFDNAPNDAFWRIIGVTKPVASVIWSEATAGCASNSLYCNKSIRPYQDHLGKALILYTDSTWEEVSATARFETGF